MKKSYLLQLLVACAVAMPASAQKLAFPKRAEAKQLPAAVAQQPLRVPTAIDDKTAGVTAYAGELYASDRKRGWINFTTGDPWNSMNRLSTFVEEDLYQISGLRAGAWTGEKYYGLYDKIYTFLEQPWFFGEIDTKTGVADTIYKYSDAEINAWKIIYEMAYDHSTGTMYALGQNTEDSSQALSDLFTCNMATGKFELLTTLDAIYYNIAFDYDGRLYGVRPYADEDDETGTVIGSELVRFNSSFEPEKVVECKKDGGSYKMGGYGSMAFDYSTGELYWATLSSNYTTLYKLDTATGTMTHCGSLPAMTQITGMYIPYVTADSRKAAARVASLDAHADYKGAFVDTVKWVNPSKAWDGTALSELAQVKVYRKKAGAGFAESSAQMMSEAQSDLVATLDASGKVGQAMSWVDNSPVNGINTYYVVPCRVSGENGVPDSIRCYVGSDVPAAPTDVKIAVKGEGIELSWVAPTASKHNAYVDSPNLTYVVTRRPDNVVVADGTKATSLTDNNIGYYNKYYYTIEAVNAAGKGVTATSEKVFQGKDLDVPVDLAFGSQDEFDRWTTAAGEGGRSEFLFGGAWNDDSECAMLYSESSNEANAWMFSAPIKLKAGTTYRFNTRVGADYVKTEYSYTMTLGKAATVEAQNIVMFADSFIVSPDYYFKQSYEFTYTPTESATYYYGFNVAGDTGYNIYRLYGVTINEVMGNDLSAVSMTGSADAVANADNKVKVTVRNLGKNAQSKYSVRIYCKGDDGDVLVGETSDVPTLAAGESAVVDMTFKPTREGDLQFYAATALSGDENTANDSCEPMTIHVEDSGSATWTNLITDESTEGQDSHTPFQLYSTHDVTESIYLANEFGVDANMDILRIGYEYEGSSSISEHLDGGDVVIYMANVDRNKYTYDSDDDGNSWITPTPLAEMTKVYEGTVGFDQGHNMVSFDLDKKFTYQKGKNLAIRIYRDGTLPKGLFFPVLFRSYNLGGTDRSCSYSEKAEYEKLNMWAYDAVPVLYLALEKATVGINNVVIGGTSARYDALNGQLVLAADVVKATVFDISGKQLRTFDASGAKRFAASLPAGFYIVRTTTADGKTASTKLNIRK